MSLNLTGWRESRRGIQDSLVSQTRTGGNLARLVGTFDRLGAIADGAFTGPSLPRCAYRPPSPFSTAGLKKSVRF